MTFEELAVYLQKLEDTSSRNEITQILSELFTKSNVDEIDKIVYLTLGQLAPSYEGVVFSIAEKMMIRILALAYNDKPDEILKLYKKSGDLGDIAQELSRSNKAKSDDMSVTEVFEMMAAIAKESGDGSQERKVSGFAQLLNKLGPLGAKYATRIPTGRLRLGFSDMTILDALSVMCTGDKSARKEIESAFNVTVDAGNIAKLVKRSKLAGIRNIKPLPGVPIRPALSERLPSAEKIMEKVGDTVAVEPKYDGLRAEIHLFEEGGIKKVRIFSRSLDNTTEMFPELVESVLKIPAKSMILDGEAIAYDAKLNKFLTFQKTAQRKRKHGIQEMVKTNPLRYFAFDILYKDGESYLNLPFSERRKILVNSLKDVDKRIEITRQNIVTKPDQIRDLIKKYLSEGLEGAMIKKIDAPYKAGARGFHWVKYKKTTEGDLADTIDCVVMGTYEGRGKRAGFGAGAFLVGVKEGNVFKTVSKIGTGLTDEQWRELKTRIQKIRTVKMPKEYSVDKNLYPDVWCEPKLVVEILADEITKSPIHTAGLALRFPRLIKFRDDKKPANATSIPELENLFRMQKEM